MEGSAMGDLDLMEEFLPGIQWDGPGRWRLPLRTSHTGYLYIKDAWLWLDAGIGRPENADILWNCLVISGLHANLRFVLDSDASTIYLRADLPFDEPASMAGRISCLFSEFGEALSTRLWEQ